MDFRSGDRGNMVFHIDNQPPMLSPQAVAYLTTKCGFTFDEARQYLTILPFRR